MIIKMREMMKHREDQKGFTLVELIIVMAILGILAAIAVPKYSSIKDTAAVKADGATAAAIINAARLYETDQDEDATIDLLKSSNYMDVPSSSQSGDAFVLSKASNKYTVEWTPAADITTYGSQKQTVTEGTVWNPTPKP